METIEELIGSESEKYYLGAEQSAILLRRLAEKGKELELTEDLINSNIKRTAIITRFCTNPYGSLRQIVESYEGTTEKIIAQGIIGSLFMTYQSRKNSGEEARFTLEDIDASLDVLTNNSLRAT